MIDTLATLNENIISLGESLKAAGIGRAKEEKDRCELVQTDADKEEAKDLAGQQDDQKQEAVVVKTQRDINVAKTMQELKGQIDQ